MSVSKEAIEAAKSAYWHEAHNGGGYSDKCYEAALTAALPFLSSPGTDGGQEVEAVAGWLWRASEDHDWRYFPGAEKPDFGFTSNVQERLEFRPLYTRLQPASTALVERLTKALEPFSFIARELFANNYNDSDIVFSVQTKTEVGSTVKLDVAFSTFREARNALSASQSTSREGER